MRHNIRNHLKKKPNILAQSVPVRHDWRNGEAAPARFRNREALTEIVNAIARDELPIDDASIRPLATPLTTPEDTEQLIAMAFAELHGLHEGNIARHRLRPSEFRRWREHHPTVTRR